MDEALNLAIAGIAAMLVIVVIAMTLIIRKQIKDARAENEQRPQKRRRK